MSDRIFKVPAILTRIAYLKDRGLSLGFSTQEVSTEEKVDISNFHGEFGYLLFKESEITESDIPAGDPTDEGLTPSQRLRRVMYVYWTRLKPKDDFDSFYKYEIDKIINSIKQKLD